VDKIILIAISMDESYSYMVKALIQPLKTELGRKDK
jgi:hypothetical protein